MLSVLPTHFSLNHLSSVLMRDPAKEYAFEAFLSHLDAKEHETAILVPTAERGAKN